MGPIREVGMGPIREVGMGPIREVGMGPIREVGMGPERERDLFLVTSTTTKNPTACILACRVIDPHALHHQINEEGSITHKHMTTHTLHHR